MMSGFLATMLSPIALKTGFTCLGLQLLFHIVFMAVLPTGPWTQLPSLTAHQLVCFPLMIYVSYLGLATWLTTTTTTTTTSEDDVAKFVDFEGRIFDTSQGGVELAQIIFGMLLIWDIPVGFMTPCLHDTLMMVHHFGMLFVSGLALGLFSTNGTPIGTYYAPFFFGVIEISTIFLSIVDLFHPKHKAWFDYLQTCKGSIGDNLRAINELCRTLFALAYLVLRTVYFPYVMFSTCLMDFWSAAMLPEEQRRGVGSWALLATLILCFFFTVLQLYWGILVGKGVAKAIGLMPDSKKNEEKKE